MARGEAVWTVTPVLMKVLIKVLIKVLTQRWLGPWSTAGKLRVERGQLLAQVTRARRSAALCTLLWESVCIMAHMVRAVRP